MFRIKFISFLRKSSEEPVSLALSMRFQFSRSIFIIIDCLINLNLFQADVLYLYPPENVKKPLTFYLFREYRKMLV